MAVSCLVLFSLLSACGRPEPVLPGISEGTIEKIDAPVNPDAPKDPDAPRSHKVTSQPYQRAEGVLIDIYHFGGRSYEALRSDVTDQFGPVQERVELGTRKGTEVRFANGRLRVLEGTIYMVAVTLPHPVTRSEALEMTGFPPFVDKWGSTHKEFRLSHAWDYERIIMTRARPRGDRVKSVEAWKTSPDRVQR